MSRDETSGRESFKTWTLKAQPFSVLPVGVNAGSVPVDVGKRRRGQADRSLRIGWPWTHAHRSRAAQDQVNEG